MKLLLTSGGITNKSIEKALLELLAKPFDKSRIVFVPTAANVEETSKGWLLRDMCRFKKLGFAYFDIVDLAALPKEIWYRRFQKADALVFGGGSVEYLLDKMSESGFTKEIKYLLANKVYVGISAGSMACAKQISISKESLDQYERTGKYIKVNGLGLVNFQIKPHLNSELFLKNSAENLTKVSQKTKVSFYAIDDETAIKVVDDKIEIVSEGEWRRFN